jgi:Mg2+/Co2+ transporter CorB
MIIDYVMIGCLIALLAFFSGAETSLVGVSKSLLHQLEMEGNKRAALVNQLYDSRKRLLSAILLGNTLTQIFASALATGVALKLAGQAGIAYSAVIMTVIVLVFCEIAPKTIAVNRADQLALFLAPLLRIVLWVLGPPVQAVNVLVDGVLRMFGFDIAREAGLEERLLALRGAIEIHAGEDEVKDERKMLRSILDLGDVQVGEIMVHRRHLATIDAGKATSVIMDEVIASQFSRLPLWKDEPDNIVGVIHTKAVLRAVRAHPNDLDTIDVTDLASPPWFIPESTSLLDQLQEFRKRREHFSLVVDEYGTLQGVVTLEDILEEIVGDISDEHDPLVSGVTREADGSYVVTGELTIRDLNREFDWTLPDEHAATIAGLLLYEARIIPEVGQQFRFHGFRFEVLKRNRNQLLLLKITPPAEESREGIRK